MIQCYKRVAQNHNLSIITSIHQPNLEILMIFDLLYVMAKGGVTVFSGAPQQLRHHLSKAHINCDENQIPIEVLMKVAADGYSDQTVIELSEITGHDLNKYEERLDNELKHYPGGITITSKSFSLQQLYYLLLRMTIYRMRFNWLQICIQNGLYLGAGCFLIIYFDFDLESNSCVPKVSNSCIQTEKNLKNDKLVDYGLKLMIFYLIIPFTLTLFFCSISFTTEFKVFFKEYRNRKQQIQQTLQTFD